MRPARRRELAYFLVNQYAVSKRRATNVMGICRSYFYYEPHPRDDRAERARIKELAEARVRYGMWRIHTLMRREGWLINHKKTHRIYVEEGLNLRRKRPRRRVAAAHRVEKPKASSLNETWSMDFVSDELFNGHRIRSLTVVDNFSRESLAITVDHRLNGHAVVATMNYLKMSNGLPWRIQVDNGSEFISKALDKWAYENYVTLDFSRPGTPTDNPFIESFNGSFRDECLNVHWFLSLEDARDKIERWRIDYNRYRPIAPLAILLLRSSGASILKPEFSSFGCQTMGMGSIPRAYLLTGFGKRGFTQVGGKGCGKTRKWERDVVLSKKLG